MIKKWLSPLFCYLFGHDKIFPHPNKKVWACVRCENGPDDISDRRFKAVWTKNGRV